MLLIAAALCLFAAACSVVEPAENTGGAKPPSGTGGRPSVEGDLFTVDLLLDGEPFAPPVAMSAKWTGEGGIFSAEFDENGHAEIEGLDGDYHVTLSALPEGYTYDPNGYMANNLYKSVRIQMLKIIPVSVGGPNVNNGDELYKPVVLTELGTYRAELNSRGHIIYYEYEPKHQGQYSIESWVDVTANEVNPIIDVYSGTKGYKLFNRRQDDGGYSSTYTKNFRLSLELSEDMVGNVWTFALYVDCRNGVYPVTVDFTVKFEDDFIGDDTIYKEMTAHGPFWNGTTLSSSRRYLYEDTGKVLDGSRVKLNWNDLNGNGVVDEGEGDGYYHLYDEATGTFGAILFTYLNKDFQVLQTESGNAFLDPLVRLKFDGKDYYPMIEEYVKSCNSNGAHPVTEELKEFLFSYAQNQRFFNDGYGWVESASVAGLKSTEANQWLFSCFYYR